MLVGNTVENARSYITKKLLDEGSAEIVIKHLKVEGLYTHELGALVRSIDSDLDYVCDRLENGVLKNELIHDLKRDGWDEESAIEAVVRTEEDFVKKEEIELGVARERHRNLNESLARGFTFIAAGFLLSIISYLVVGLAGGWGIGLFFTGPILIGMYIVIRAYYRHSKGQSLDDEA